MLFLLLAMTEVRAQGATYTIDVDLRLGKVDAQEMILVILEPIRAGVVFQRLPYPSSCPSSRPGEFALKKINPGSGFATLEPIGTACGFLDSVIIDTSFVYEVHTPRGELFYLRMIETQGGKARLRITTAKPSTVLPKRSAREPARSDDKTYRADGREDAFEEAWKAGKAMPIFQRME